MTRRPNVLRAPERRKPCLSPRLSPGLFVPSFCGTRKVMLQLRLQARTAVQARTHTGTSKYLPSTVRYLRYLRRERNLLARPTLDMYLPLSKFESIHWVSIDATV